MEAVMRTILFMLAVLVATALGQRPGHAYGDAPWCALMVVGNDSVVERCEFWSIDTCRTEVISGNRGFCNPNPRFSGYSGARSQKRKRAW
jgi:hypothetical protein